MVNLLNMHDSHTTETSEEMLLRDYIVNRERTRRNLMEDIHIVDAELAKARRQLSELRGHGTLNPGVGDDKCDRFLRMIEGAGKTGISAGDLGRRTSNVDKDTRATCLQTLIDENRIRLVITRAKVGRPSHTYFIIEGNKP